MNQIPHVCYIPGSKKTKEYPIKLPDDCKMNTFQEENTLFTNPDTTLIS